MNQSQLQHLTRTLVTVQRFRDVETSAHVARVTRIALRLGREMRLSPRDTNGLRIGALLHDIGKVFILDSVLRKPGPLTDDEWAHVREHVNRARCLLEELRFPCPIVCVVAQHHEHWDGNGYPMQLKGEQICIGARVFAVADTFDAITSNRCYRRSNNYEAADAEIERCSGTQFDPAVTRAFRQIPAADWSFLAEPAGTA